MDHSIKHSSEVSRKYHVELLIFKMNDMILITGYKSPTTPAKIFEDLVKQTLDIWQHDRIILMGDFNIDLSQIGNNFQHFMKAFQMENKLSENDLTTDNNTQIDVIFANFKNIVAGTYESCFSDHKPIWCMLHNEEIPPEIIDHFESSRFTPELQPQPREFQINLDRIKISEQKPKSKPQTKSNE